MPVPEFVSLARLAGRYLRQLLDELEEPMQENGSNDHFRRSRRLPSGFKKLDDALGLGGVPEGATVELWSAFSRELFWFSSHWVDVLHLRGRNIVLVDPFSEFDPTQFRCNRSDSGQIMVVNVVERDALTRLVSRLMEEKNTDLVVLPPGIMAQQYLSYGAITSDATKPIEAAFEQAIQHLAWLGRRTGVSLLLMRHVSEDRYPPSLASAQVHLRILERSPYSGRRLRIEHNVLAPETMGKLITLPD